MNEIWSSIDVVFVSWYKFQLIKKYVLYNAHQNEVSELWPLFPTKSINPIFTCSWIGCHLPINVHLHKNQSIMKACKNISHDFLQTDIV